MQVSKILLKVSLFQYAFHEVLQLKYNIFKRFEEEVAC